MRVLFRIACACGIALVWSAAAHATTFTVTTNDDGDHGSCAAICTLRDAVKAANANAGADTIEFAVGGFFVVDSANVLPALTGPVTIDGTTAPGYPTYEGPAVRITPGGNSLFDGLTLQASGSTVKAIRVEAFAVGIRFSASNGVLQGSRVENSSTADVVIDGGSNTLIGGSGEDEGNVFRTGGAGVWITAAASGNHIEGNLIGCKPVDDGGCPNGEGVFVEGPDNVIGGGVAGAGNTVAGNQGHGITILGAAATGNKIQGNIVGYPIYDGNYTAWNKLSGIYIGGSGTLVGGTTPAERNVISGNAYLTSDIGAGVFLAAPGNTVQGNYIGTTVDGNNSALNWHNGIDDEVGGNVIGGTVAGAGNLVSGNREYGIRIAGPGDTVAGNFVGVNAAGNEAIGGGDIGVLASNTTIGGTSSGARNLISGNHIGIRMPYALLNGVVVEGNWIGLNADGTGAIPNGVGIESRATSVTIGGTAPGAGNVISGNDGAGVNIIGGLAIPKVKDLTGGGLIAGNLIGTTPDGTTPLPNETAGIRLMNCVKLLVGGSASGARNVISGNDGPGVLFLGGQACVVAGNYIGTDASGTGAVANTEDGIFLGGVDINGKLPITVGGIAFGAGNIISGNTWSGIHAQANEFTAGLALIQGNRIGTSADGMTAVPNGLDGIRIEGSSRNTVGHKTPAGGNLISGNAGSGVNIVGDPARQNLLLNNQLGTDSTGAPTLGNGGDGVRIDGGAQNKIGMSKSGNVVAGNGAAGVAVYAGIGNSIVANSLFANSGLGIDLGGDGSTPNDPLDPDTGPDNVQNFPLLNPPTTSNGKTLVTGTLNTAPGKYTIYLYASPATDSPPEARLLVGKPAKRKADAQGNLAFAVKISGLAAGTFLTAVAVDSVGNTSELSLPVTV